MYLDGQRYWLEGDAKYVCDKYLEHMHMHDAGKLENSLEGNNPIEAFVILSRKSKDHEYGSGKAEIHEIDFYMDDRKLEYRGLKVVREFVYQLKQEYWQKSQILFLVLF